MFSKSTVFFLHALTPLHAGSGTSLSTIDLPIQREKNTHLPMIAGSGVKGAMREYFEKSEATKNDVNVIFGPDSNASDYAGSAAFSDAKLLFFPVKSYTGVFAWVTCPYALERFSRDYKHIAKKDVPFSVEDINRFGNDAAFVSEKPGCVTGKEIILEDFIFKPHKPGIEALVAFFANQFFEKDSYWYKKFVSDLVIVSDDSFKQFTEYSTEVQARIKIGDEGTVEGGALFYEENMPSETIFYCTLCISNPHKKDPGELKTADDILRVITNNTGSVIQFGGDATIGKGLMHLHFTRGE